MAIVTNISYEHDIISALLDFLWSLLTEQKSKASQLQVDVYNSDHGPFLYITQYKLATHLVTISYSPT